ncbi:M20 family metallo-hydrolase [Pollutibacter soli]|uniref:M20 family metallo-hydrolase n=1 Tax=Pollutibacter soli TaxID=3034157 RepID=UPI0030141866
MALSVSLYESAKGLLKELISTPSFSREEDQTAGVITRFLALQRIEHARTDNNVYAFNKYFDPAKPTILLNSHHDTVKPAKGYTLDPFTPIEKDGKLFGLGSNDAGGPLVSLIASFVHFYDRPDLKYNLILAATAEEEISGSNGVEALLQKPFFLEKLEGKQIDAAIVGEPTLMQMAVAERGLLVIDAIAHGKAGHAARNEGINAISIALKDIEWINGYQFSKVSPLLDKVKMSVTVIETENKAHNVVPSTCRFVIDTRVNELYSFDEILNTLTKNLQSEIQPRSTRLKSTAIALEHPLVKAGIELGRSYYGSPTTSDKALMDFPALKMGPGDSARSHTADEFIFLTEIEEGIDLYIRLLSKLMN